MMDRDSRQIPGRKVTFSDGTYLYAAGLKDRCVDHPSREFGLYLERQWNPEWPAILIDWPDFGIPTDEREATAQIWIAFQHAKAGQTVEVGCAGGLGRTGTVLACMAVLSGESPSNAVKWVRTHYDARAVETCEQEDWVKTFTRWDFVWCNFRNMTHSVYREIRHIGVEGDYDAKFVVNDDFKDAAIKCRNNRHSLKSKVPYLTCLPSDSDKLISCYESLSGVNLDGVIDLYKSIGWRYGYGGSKWAKIACDLRRLKDAVSTGDLQKCEEICHEVASLSHNSGPLVPKTEEWEKNPWLQEKWPVLCKYRFM